MAIDSDLEARLASAAPPQGEPVPVDGEKAPRRLGVLDRILGITGELLIAAGVILGLFVLWQLFYTDVQADRVQDEIVEEFIAPITADQGSGQGGDVSAPDVVQTIPAEFQFTDDPPVMSEPDHAETFAVMYVPRWGEDYVKPISQGTDRRTVLDVLGIGHYEGTAMPGGLGNFAVAGHRTTYGKPFNRVAELEVGDSVIVQTDEAYYVYEIYEYDIVRPTDVQVVAPVPNQPGVAPDGRYLTMTTCHPLYSAAQRWIVHAEMKYWAPLDQGIPPEMVEDLS